jgi:hypothetical protein
MSIYYAGIGARSIGPEVERFFKGLGKFYAQQGYILRSGGARGSDQSFEYGCDLAGGSKEIYLPYKGFNGNSSELYHVSQEAMSIAREVCPHWDYLSEVSRRLLGRNVYQILGPDLCDPVKFVACYTEDGEKKGGTRVGIMLAEKYGLPVFNYGLVFSANVTKQL